MAWLSINFEGGIDHDRFGVNELGPNGLRVILRSSWTGCMLLAVFITDMASNDYFGLSPIFAIEIQYVGPWLQDAAAQQKILLRVKGTSVIVESRYNNLY